MTIKGNESVALVGTSGSGKSTIASLLLRFYNKQAGKILIDGHEIEDYSVKQIREQIAIVMQEPLLFNEPIKENIRYGNLTSTDAEVLQASEQANCLQFIQNSQDQLCIPEIKAQIETEFKATMTSLVAQRQNFGKLRDFISAEKLVIEEILLIKEVLE